MLAGVEECDDNDTIDTNSCTNQCKRAGCGDKIVQTGVEQCDDGNNVTTDACINCVNATCGDLHIWSGK